MPKEFTRKRYKGWTIEGKGHGGMYTATHPDFWRFLKADTLEGMRGLITRYTPRKEFQPREYKGWTIDRVAHSGMYNAFKVGHFGYLKADTLQGMKDIITASENGELNRGF